MSDDNRTILYEDEFNTLQDHWNLFESDADSRNSFVNEGKAGEIMALENTSVFAEKDVPTGTRVFLVKINPGTDHSSSWGPGLGLVFGEKVIKLNLRPGKQQIGFYDGENEVLVSGVPPGQSIWLRMEVSDGKIKAAFSQERIDWQFVGETSVDNGLPEKVRIGKMDWMGGSSDHVDKGGRGRCKVEEFYMLGSVPENIKEF